MSIPETRQEKSLVNRLSTKMIRDITQQHVCDRPDRRSRWAVFERQAASRMRSQDICPRVSPLPWAENQWRNELKGRLRDFTYIHTHCRFVALYDSIPTRINPPAYHLRSTFCDVSSTTTQPSSPRRVCWRSVARPHMYINYLHNPYYRTAVMGKMETPCSGLGSFNVTETSSARAYSVRMITPSQSVAY
jgi:hypothetical protein